MLLIYDEDLLTVMPPRPEIENLLTYTYKKMEYDWNSPGGRAMTMERIRVFDKLEKEGKYVAIQTHSGFVDKVRDLLNERKIPYTFKDLRREFPQARLDLMRGFRFNQRALLTQGLMQNRSGLIGAPTRYGKSHLLLNIVRAYPNLNTVVLAPGEDLLRQNYTFLKENLKREVTMLGGGSKKRFASEQVTVCSMDSMHKLDHGRVELVIIDEPHALVTPARTEAFLPLMHARKIGLGATLDGRFDGRDIYIVGLIGPVLSKVTFKEAVVEGAICPIHVLMLKHTMGVTGAGTKDTMYKRVMFENKEFAETVARIGNEIIPKKWQTLTFIKNEKQGLYLQNRLEDQALIMAKRCTAKMRKVYTNLMQLQVIKKALATRIYSTGVTFSHLRCLINAEGGGAGIMATQKGGRLAEVRDGKACGILFDFMMTPTSDHHTSERYKHALSIHRDSKNRAKMYEDLGYQVHICEDFDQLKQTFERYAYG